ncbi:MULTISPECIES: TrbI/VirB10 family protein [unclassified Lysobacter]|uniref:TrbI/VirB10 family protein n=1 Tax=unclassified Lysobacter TaxID=2635362 RepID=UPI001BEA3C4E|nr:MULTISPECIES: TrbI/VirB10 family protein [unclassified Lysobacter]MBT2746762.1 TrbI/VirB10 family protein [Lysobacter sp. ISL-42]MBT2751811.1 TrbI/VirB10 family protein [Lysobacter sp. ISL-50]MBT2778163.1 TrbI/VirB10 family protein [Lysobacter sp. ISL-54]MBT2781804.1 TrbI/VirB10 family protein [Lysobacter sp. ISL-52]
MSQNMPPNQPGQPEGNNGTPQEGGSYGYAGANPYYGQQGGGAAAPDLDANAPMLKSSDVQRLNRKALLFLGAIVLLLLAAAFFLLKSATSGDDEPKKVDEEVVTVPDAPVGAQSTALPPLPPPTVAAEPIGMVPPLPPEQPESQGNVAEAEPRDRGPSLLERRMAGEVGSSGGGQGGENSAMTPSQQYLAMVAAQNGQGGQAAQPEKPEVASAQPLYNPDTLLLRGTYIRCIMETRIITDIPGFSSCVVTEPVYSVNGRRLLLPKGSKVSGRYQGNAGDLKRVAVLWDRITTPTGLDVNMASPGIDGLGGAGIPGQYDAHWGSRIASALLISLISDAFKYAAAENGPESTTVTQGGTVITQPYESNTARAMERLANQALDKSVNRPATVTINQGSVVNIYVAKDVDFSSVLR